MATLKVTILIPECVELRDRDSEAATAAEVLAWVHADGGYDVPGVRVAVDYAARGERVAGRFFERNADGVTEVA